MGYLIPYFNVDTDDIRTAWNARIQNEKTQKRLVLIIVSIAMLLDNMLYMVIVPILPSYLESIGAYHRQCVGGWKTFKYKNGSYGYVNKSCTQWDYIGEEQSLGFLFASKAILQLLVNPFSGTLIDRIGYEIPMVIGLVVMFMSTAVFALGQSYGLMFFARSIQGLGSAFADTSGFAMIADRFNEEDERSRALGIAIAFISFGSLVAPPFGGVLYEFAGKPVPFLLLSLLCLADAIMTFMVIHPQRCALRKTTGERLQGTPIWRLFLDPYIAVCAGALVMANVGLAFLEPTISSWMKESMPGVKDWQLGIVWLPAFFPHLAGVYATVYLLRRFPQSPWLLAAIGLCIEGLSCLMIPFCDNFFAVMFPISILCFGIALIDTSILPLLAYLVDTRHVSIYGSVYAIADISYSIAYALGPIVAGQVVATLGFLNLNIGICVFNLVYSPLLYFLRPLYQYRSFRSEDGVQLHGIGFDNKTYGTYSPESMLNYNNSTNQLIDINGRETIKQYNPDDPFGWANTITPEADHKKHQIQWHNQS